MCCHQQMTNSNYALPLNDWKCQWAEDTLENRFHCTKSMIETHVSFLIHFTSNYTLLTNEKNNSSNFELDPILLITVWNE